MAPESTRRLAIEVGKRTLALAQRFVPHVAQVFAPDCAPLFLTDGWRAYLPALLTHSGDWGQPPRRQEKGPPPPRWRPLPQGRSAQGGKTVRQRRLGRVSHRVVCGAREALHQGGAAGGWPSHTAGVARLNLSRRPPVAAIGRRGRTRCQGEAGVRPPRTLAPTSYHLCFPPASLRQALPPPEPPQGGGSPTPWRPWTPARRAGLPHRVWPRREVWLSRVPPWPPP
jgi:hypothetical protein